MHFIWCSRRTPHLRQPDHKGLRGVAGTRAGDLGSLLHGAASPASISHDNGSGLNQTNGQVQPAQAASAHPHRLQQLQQQHMLDRHRSPRDSPEYEPYQTSQLVSDVEGSPEPEPESDKEAGEIDEDDEDDEEIHIV